MDIGTFEETYKGRDIILYTETHQYGKNTLPAVPGYKWESVARKKPRGNTSRGSGGVAVLYREELYHIIQVMGKDEHARYMWIRIQVEDHCPLYIAVCYFAPSNSDYAGPNGQSPYAILDEDIMHYSQLGDILLAGDFNARTESLQASFFETSEAEMREYDNLDLGIERISQDKGKSQPMENIF